MCSHFGLEQESSFLELDGNMLFQNLNALFCIDFVSSDVQAANTRGPHAPTYTQRGRFLWLWGYIWILAIFNVINFTSFIQSLSLKEQCYPYLTQYFIIFAATFLFYLGLYVSSNWLFALIFYLLLWQICFRLEINAMFVALSVSKNSLNR